MKKKKCRVCANVFLPTRAIQPVCSSYECQVAYAQKVAQAAAIRREKARRADTAKRKKKLKTRSDWLKEAQAAFNRYIRARDYGNPCISCGRVHSGKVNAGHYRSVGAAPELRFNELNVHLQCEPCNSYLSGNIIEYRIGLVHKIGEELVDWIEGKHEPLRLGIDEIAEIKKAYSAKAREQEKINVDKS